MPTLTAALALLAATGFAAIGAAALFNPAVLSHLYGTYVHEPNGRAFVRAAGVRDLAFGALLAFFSRGDARALVATLLAGAAIAAGDFIIALRANRRFERGPLLGHLAGLISLAAFATFVGMANPPR